MYCFPMDRELTKEERAELVGDNWLEAAYEFQKLVYEQDKYLKKRIEEDRIRNEQSKRAEKSFQEWIKKLWKQLS